MFSYFIVLKKITYTYSYVLNKNLLPVKAQEIFFYYLKYLKLHL